MDPNSNRFSNNEGCPPLKKNGCEPKYKIVLFLEVFDFFFYEFRIQRNCNILLNQQSKHAL
jgi:hypothetical protein